MNKNWVKGVIVTVGLASLAVYFVARERALSVERSAHDATLEDLREQVDRLGKEQRRTVLASRLSAMQMMRAERSSEAPRAALPPVRDDAWAREADAEGHEGTEAVPPLDPVEQARADLAEYRGILEDTFVVESVDASWAPDAERAAYDALSAALPESSRLTGVTCHETLCRAEVLHVSTEDHRQLLRRLAEEIAWEGPSAMLYHEAASGEVKTLAYLGRVDMEFPSLVR